MTLKASKAISLIGAVVSLLLAGAAPVQAAGEDMYDYTKIPPFIEVGLNPNLLMLIDNSASMYDPAYGAPAGSSCYAADYDTAKPYAGYFEPTDDSWYVYDSADHRFESASASDANSACSGATGDHYTAADLCLSVDATPDPDVVTAFAAKGRFLNWLAASKFDVEKEILTGGKYNSTRKEMVLEARGCLEERFVKQTPVSKGGTNYFAVFGIRPPSNTEKIADMAYYGDPAIFATTNNTRIEIFKPSLTGFNATACDNAIAYWATPGADLGTLKTKTTACLGGNTSLLIASNTALNHILQECWYYKSFGDFQNGAGTVTSLRNDCEDVYNITPGSTPGAGDNYVPPGSLRVSDVCSGIYGPYEYDDWGYGYVGKCWEPKTSMEPEECTSANPPLLAKNAVQDALGNYYYCDLAIDGDANPATGWYRQCAKEPNRTNGNCPGGWATRKVAVGVPGAVDWTDDDMGLATSTTSDDTGAGKSQGYTCIDDALRSYCQNLDDVTVVDPDVNDPLGTAWSLPAVLIGTATEAQLGAPLKALEGRVYKTSAPNGLIHEFKYNLRMGAMKFNPGPVSECVPVLRADGTWKASLYDCLQDKGSDIDNSTEVGRHVSLPDPAKLDGGKLVREIDDGDVHVAKLVTAINSIAANAWTPLAEAYSEAVGYYTQRKSSRLNGGTGAPGTANDYICDQDAALYPDWVANHTYNAGDRVKATWDYDDDGANETKLYFTDAGGTSTAAAANIGKDLGVRWTPFDPVLAGCQSNNILIITDGTSTADLNSQMAADVTGSGYNDGDFAKVYHSTVTNSDVLELANYECKNPTDLHTLYGSSLLDDLSYYANARTAAALFVDASVGALAKKKIITYVVATGSLGEATDYECNPKFQLQQVAASNSNPATELLESSDMAMLEVNLRKIFKTIGGEPASGSAASVISNSRSGEGAIFQAVFYPNQEDAAGREITWAGDVHALWLDERGNIREDCGSGGCAVGNEDWTLDKTVDRILQFYTDDISGAARARSFTDADGDGNIDDLNGDGDIDADDKFADNISLRDIPYLWSAGEWLSEVTEANVDTHRPYGDIAKQRHILTSINGTTMIPFTPSALRTALGSDSAYYGYVGFGAANPDNVNAAAKVDEANDIISYVRGDDSRFKLDGTTRGYRSRLIDWYGDGTPEVWKLGDIVSSTPTVVSTPAEDYDLVYGDTSYQAFRQRYRNRRAMVYAGGNDGGLHAFNGGYYNRATNMIDKAPPVDTDNITKKEYDLGGEMWMFVPKNAIPHLKWLTDPNYSHVNYVDLKPYIFDAKIFTPDTDHPQGWGTLLVGGMGFGGGDIGVDTNADGNDDQIMRASYFVLDITNPEVAPAILREFTDPALGYPIGSPTAIPMLLCTLKIDCPTDATWHMDWFLALPSGPHDATLPMAALNAKSDQNAKIFTLPLGGTGKSGHLGPVGSTFSPDLVTFTTSDAAFTNSFFTDVIAVDYDLNFKTDALYFGSVAHAVSDTTGTHTGGIHRLVTNENSDRNVFTPWVLNTFFKTPGFQPVSGSPSVAYDGQRAWIYFGTGRYYTAQLDKKNLVQQSYYGIKENYDADNEMDLLSVRTKANLVDVSKVWVEKGGNLHVTGGSLPLSATDYVSMSQTFLPADTDTFKKLDLEMSQKVSGVDKYNGWKLDFDPLNGERNLGQAAILGNIVTFTTFVPSEDLCKPEGESFLWATYYRTGTAYYKSVIGLDIDNPTEVVRKVSVGAGLASTPNIHSGAEAGATAFVQTSTGAIVSVQQDTPGVVKSGMQSWRELRN